MGSNNHWCIGVMQWEEFELRLKLVHRSQDLEESMHLLTDCATMPSCEIHGKKLIYKSPSIIFRPGILRGSVFNVQYRKISALEFCAHPLPRNSVRITQPADILPILP